MLPRAAVSTLPTTYYLPLTTYCELLTTAARRGEHPAHDLGRRDAFGARDCTVLA